MNCPRCQTALRHRAIQDVGIHECSACGGLFLPHGAIERIVEDRAGHTLALDLLAILPRAPISPVPPPGQRMYISCPTCGTLMNRKLFATGAGIVIDVCRSDGAFFDAGELPAIVDFVMDGGLEVAARKDAARILEERRKLRQQRIAAAVTTRGSASFLGGPADSDAGLALVDLLGSLFF